MTSRTLIPVVLIGCTVVGVRPLGADTPFHHGGYCVKHSKVTLLANEHVDPASGTLMIVATDLVLPGNAGFDLRVTRIYNSSLFPEYNNGGSTVIDEDSWAGIGWRLHFGRVINPDAPSGGATIVDLGDGGSHPLYSTNAFPEGWITPEFARYDRSAHVLKLPNGYVYTFGHAADLGGALGVVRMVTEIRDPFNNRIEVDYMGAPGPPGLESAEARPARRGSGHDTVLIAGLSQCQFASTSPSTKTSTSG